MNLLPAIAAIALATTVSAVADPRKAPTSDYSADLVQNSEGQGEVRSKIYSTKDHVRVDTTQAGKATILILDRVKKQLVVLMPDSKSYQTMPAPDDSDPFGPISGDGLEAAQIGEEAVNGIPTTKWQVKVKEGDDGLMTATIWTTKEHIQIKTEGSIEDDGKTESFSTELTNLEIGPVDAQLFEVPPEYKLAQ